jgi:hypothetical protein
MNHGDAVTVIRSDALAFKKRLNAMCRELVKQEGHKGKDARRRRDFLVRGTIETIAKRLQADHEAQQDGHGIG